MKGLEFKNSCARLLAVGLVGPVQSFYAGSPNTIDLELLIDGRHFAGEAVTRQKKPFAYEQLFSQRRDGPFESQL